ncbi:ATP-binding protein [Maricurvus nonylphenolicus]|uniref:ATP-binding protein n=1 Tax=Maricurvus nonylphenolicus TaxID=1008307 RepID=UPI0036F1C704
MNTDFKPQQNNPMRSIFFRIYSGMLLATILIITLLYAGFQQYNQHRLNNYLNDVAKGTFTLIAQGLARHQGSKRQEWFEVVKRLTGLNLALSSQKPETLTSAQIERLLLGDMIIRPDLGDKVATLFVSVPGEEQLFLSTEIDDVNEQLSRVTALLILNDLGRYPKDQRDKALVSLQKTFGFPLIVSELKTTTLDATQLRRVKRGDIVVTLNDTTFEAPYIQVYAKYGNSGKLLILGPIALFNWFPSNIILLLGFVGLLLLAVCSYGLVRPLERRLQAMELEVDKVGTELAPAVSVEGDDAISRFGLRVNSMAMRIQGLLEEQRELTHAISHELRTPVSRLKFRLENLNSPISEEKRQQTIEGINKDLNELNALIDEILTFASLESGSLNFSPQPLNINQLLDNLINETSLLSPHLSLNIDAQTATTDVMGIEHLLNRAIQNLLLNATRHAKTQVQLSFTSNQHNYEIRVADDGTGIPEQDRERIFTPFTRLDKSRNRSSGGFGLGLAIVDQIAQWHQGSVALAHSELGGAEFIFTWPKPESQISL